MSKRLHILCFFVVANLSACSGSRPKVENNRGGVTPHPVEISTAEGDITSIAAREVIRRQNQIRRADAAALRANRFSAEGDPEAAIRSYRKALDTLPSND